MIHRSILEWQARHPNITWLFWILVWLVVFLLLFKPARVMGV